MIRRTFLGSLLSGIGLGWVLPKAKAEQKVELDLKPYIGKSFPEPFCLTFTHQHEPKVDVLDDVIVYGLKDGRPICQLIAQHAIVTQRLYGAAAKNPKGEIVWKSPPPYRQETEVSLSGLFGPAPLMSVLATIFGDVMQARYLSLVIVSPEFQKRVDISYPVLATIGCNVAAPGSAFWTHANFLGAKVEEKHDQWDAADLKFPTPIYDKLVADFDKAGIQVGKPLEGLGYDWKKEQQRLLNEQIAHAQLR